MNTGTLTFPNNSGNLGFLSLYNAIRPPTVITNGITLATANNHYIFANNTTTISLVLPHTPTPGSVIWVTNVSSIFTHFCDRNGQRINGLAENLFLDVAYKLTVLRWIDPITGWAVI